jgi:hypothetical protein
VVRNPPTDKARQIPASTHSDSNFDFAVQPFWIPFDPSYGWDGSVRRQRHRTEEGSRLAARKVRGPTLAWSRAHCLNVTMLQINKPFWIAARGFSNFPRPALYALDAYVLRSSSRMRFAVRKLSAARVNVGLAVAPVGNVCCQPDRGSCGRASAGTYPPSTVWIVAHPAGSHDVAGADLVQCNGLAVNFLVETSRIVLGDRRKFGKIQF